MNTIQTNNLTKMYGKNRGITDVNLSVTEGDFFGFIGPNGAGKSTLIRTLLGLLNPTSGSATIFGKDITTDRLSILEKVGYLSSDATFYGGMKVSEVIKYSAKLRGFDCSAEAKKLCDRLELDTTKKVRQLSLGNRKKLGIVCAMQHKPSLYIMDEPTSGLDPLMQHEFFELLSERNAEGATIFLSSHNLNEVAQYCNNAAIIKNGKILISDSVEKLTYTDVKRVSLRGLQGELPAGIAGIRKVIREKENNMSFIYGGSHKELTDLLSSLEFDDFTVTNPELEEIFLDYYKKEDN